jgi:hypothetical protein
MAGSDGSLRTSSDIIDAVKKYKHFRFRFGLIIIIIIIKTNREKKLIPNSCG